MSATFTVSFVDDLRAKVIRIVMKSVFHSDFYVLWLRSRHKHSRIYEITRFIKFNRLPRLGDLCFRRAHIFIVVF